MTRVSLNLLANNIHQPLFYLLLFLLPSQIGKHFWPSEAFIWGLPIDYLSPRVYLTDLIVLGILLSWWWGSKRQPRRRKPSFVLVTGLVLLLANFLIASNKLIFILPLLKLMEYILLASYIARAKHRQSWWRPALSGAMIYSSFLAIAQFIKQGTLGGLFWWLGERTFSIATPGIAKTNLTGQLRMRAYATFSHPHVLAGFLLVSAILLIFYTKRKGFFFWSTLVLAVVAFYLTFSQISWLAGFVFLSYYVFRQNKWRQIYWLAVFFGLLVWLLGGGFKLAPASVSRRWELALSGLSMIKKNLLLGVGLGHFLPRLPSFWQGREGIRFLQPVHNIFLLMTAETGLLGFSYVLLFLRRTIRRLIKEKKQVLICALVTIGFLGLFDHYWLTLQQGQLLLTFILGLSWRQEKT